MPFSDIFSPAPASREKAQPELLLAVLFGKVLGKRFAHQRSHRDGPATRQRLEISLHPLVNKHGRSLHMTYGSISASL